MGEKINNFEDCEEKKQFIEQIKKKFGHEELLEKINLLKNLKVLVIGDTIIDVYTYVLPKGRAIKDPILSTEFTSEDIFAGGALAVANHVSSYVDCVSMVTLIGDHNSYTEFINQSLSKNIQLKTFVKENSPTIVKKRYIDSYRKNKLFKVEYMNDKPIPKELSEQIKNYLSEELPKYDLVLVLDYNHGFIDNEIKKILQEKSKFLSLNVQTNSANMGYNYVTSYDHSDFICMNEEELRLPLMMKFENIEEVINQFSNKFGHKQFLVTRGKKGCIFSSYGKNYSAPILIEKIVDTVGAGDAVFAIASLLACIKIDEEIIPFIANCAGGLGANIIGNKEPVSKEKLLNFVEKLYYESITKNRLLEMMEKLYDDLK